MNRRIAIILGIAVAAAMVAVLLFPGHTIRLRETLIQRKLLEKLDLPDRETRKRAAWAAMEHPSQKISDFMIRGLMGHEADPDVREAYAYALGNLGDPGALAALERTVDTDESGFARCSAWLAIVRLDPEHFRVLAEAGARREDPWDRLGVAQARLSLGDARDYKVLFEQARSRDESRRMIAYRALTRGLKPVLDAAGYWPLEFQPSNGEDWPIQWLEEIEKRCAMMDVGAIADQTYKRLAASFAVRRNIMRINGARQELIGFLFGKRSEAR